MDIREHIDDPEEMMRLAHASLAAGMMFALPCTITEDSADGHTVSAQPTIRRKVIDAVTAQTTYEDWPIHPDVPIHHLGGGLVTHTTPTKKGDEGHLVYMSRQIDGWHQNGQIQNPFDNALHDLKDVLFVKGLRSTPRKLAQVPNTSAQVRDDDKHHVIDHDPVNGITHKSVDPSTAKASVSFDPFTMASKFFSHALHPSNGILGQAVDGAISHTHGVGHDLGAFMTALSGAHSVLAHPQNGASMNAANLLHQVLCHPQAGAAMKALNGLHQVLAHPDIGAALMGSGGVSSVIAKASLALKSAAGISFDCPASGFSLPGKSITAPSIADGAASTNVGALGGDLVGNLPNPQVVGIGNVDATNLPHAANDAAAAALNPPVQKGFLYVNTGAVSGVGLLAVRLS